MKSQTVTPADLCQIRKILRRSPTAMAEIVGVTTAEWEAWESGESIPTLDQLAQLIAMKRLAAKLARPARYTETKPKKRHKK